MNRSDEIKEKRRQYYLKNREAILRRVSTYQKENKEKKRIWSKRYREANKDKRRLWLEANREKVREQLKKRSKQRLLTDPAYKLACQLRHRLNMALKHEHKRGSAIKDLGCSVPELKEYLECKFTEGMTWENHTQFGWHIDHIKPLNSFDLSDYKQLSSACHYTNLQPLWASDNLIKSKYEVATTR